MEAYNTQDYQAYINFLYKRKPEIPESEKYYKGDMHIHSEYSFDSVMTLDSIVREAEKAKLEYVGIADHIDFGNEATLDVVDRIKLRNEEIDKLAEKTNVRILKGVEVGEPHLYSDEMEYLRRIEDLDYIIGSIHYIKGKTLNECKNCKEIVNKYFREVLNMVKYSDIDIVGHLDYLKKYVEIYNLDPCIIYQILDTIHYSNFALEINTGGLRRNVGTYPSDAILEAYTRIGGKKITYGSDAHEESELFTSIEDLSKKQKIYKLSSGVIIDHKFKQI